MAPVELLMENNAASGPPAMENVKLEESGSETDRLPMLALFSLTANRSGMVPAMTGASFTGVTVSLKSSLMLAVPSDAVTRRSMLPLKLSGGVPEKIRVLALNDNQDGRATPLASEAV